MASPLSTQLTNDLIQNFYWSYVSQNEQDIEIVNLEMTVAQFLEFIDIDLDGDPYNPEDLVTLYYAMSEKSSDPGVYYFTYMIANSLVEMGSIVNLGIINSSNEYLLIEEDGDYSAINNTIFQSKKAAYESASIYSPYINETTIIGVFTNHPLMCSFQKEDFKNFILDNMTSPEMDLSTLTLVFQLGATYYSGLNSNYKVETAIVTTKDSSGLRLDGINYMDKPFENKSMDVGQICPPSCG